MTKLLYGFYAVLLCSASAGCAGAEVDPEPVYPELPAQQTGCPTTYVNPDPELLEYTEQAAARWLEATGRCIVIDPSGIPLHAQGYVFMTPENTIVDADPLLQYDDVCGATQKHANNGVPVGIWISTEHPLCDHPASTVAHELGHLWGKDGTHAEEGLGAEGWSPHKTDVISESTLMWVCSEVECPEFRPEG